MTGPAGCRIGEVYGEAEAAGLARGTEDPCVLTVACNEMITIAVDEWAGRPSFRDWMAADELC